MSFLFLSRRHLQRVFEWREKPSSWCIADVVTYSVVCEWWLQSCRFLVLCDVKVHAARSLPPVCFFGVLLLLVGCAHAVTRTFHGVAPRSVLSWIPRRVRSGAADGMWRHRRRSGASRSALCFLCSPIQRLGAGSDFDDEFQNRCHERRKNAWSQNADDGQRSQCCASGHDTRTHVS